MTMENKQYYLLFIGSVLFSSFSQILLKKSANKEYQNKLREYLNPYVISAYSIFVLVTVVNIYAYKFIPVSYGAVLESLGYIFVAVLDRIFFKVKVSLKKNLGLLIIMAGVIVICL